MGAFEEALLPRELKAKWDLGRKMRPTEGAEMNAAETPRSDTELLELAAEYAELHAVAQRVNAELGSDVSNAAEARYEAEVTPRVDRMWVIEDLLTELHAQTPEGIRAKARVFEAALVRCVAEELAKTFEEQAEPRDLLARSLIRDILGSAAA